MALDIAGGVRQRLVSDNTLTGMLATYAFEDGDGPAIFVDPVPPNYEVVAQPSIIVSEPFDNRSDDDFTTERRAVALRIRIYAKQDGSAIGINAAAERARALFRNWSTPSFSTGELEASFVAGPTNAPTDDPSTEGRLLVVELKIKE